MYFLNIFSSALGGDEESQLECFGMGLYFIVAFIEKIFCDHHLCCNTLCLLDVSISEAGVNKSDSIAANVFPFIGR